MKRYFTLTTSRLSLLVPLLIFFFVSCSTRVEQETKDQPGLEAAKTVKELPAITVATLDATVAKDGYFDLIVEASNCLGENLWIGGKLEGNKGEATGEKEFKITLFTVTGLNSNLSYNLENKAGTIKAISDESGVVLLQLQEGLLQLKPISNSETVVLAYRAEAFTNEPDASPGYWSCR